MAKTFLRILLDVQNQLGVQKDQTVSLSYLDDAFQFFWNYHPWRETIGVFRTQ